MKRIMATMMIVVLLSVLSGCSNKTQENEGKSDNNYDGTQISLSDSEIKVNGSAVSTDST